MALTVVQQKYQFWLATHPDDRPPKLKTHDEFCAKFGVTKAQLYAWEHLPGFWDGAFIRARAEIGKRLPQIMRALARKAETGQVSAIKLALQALGVYSDRLDIDVGHRLDTDQLVVYITPALPAQPAQSSQPALPAQPSQPALPAQSDQSDQSDQLELIEILTEIVDDDGEADLHTK